MNNISWLWYWLTPWLPRRLPASEKDWDLLQEVLILVYGVEDSPKAWLTVAGHISSVPSVRIRMPWGHLANAANRLEINALAQGVRGVCMQELQRQLAEATKKEADDKGKLQQDSEKAPNQVGIGCTEPHSPEENETAPDIEPVQAEAK